MHELYAEIIVISLMLVFNAAFAAYEMALASVSKPRIRHLKEKNVPGSASAHFMKERMEASLSLIQLGITLAGIIAAATGGAAVNEYISPALAEHLALSKATAEMLGLTLFVVPLSFITITFGELVPKVFAIENKELVLLRFSPFFKGLYLFVYPVLQVFEMAIKAVIAGANAVLPARKNHNEHAALSELRQAAAQARDESLIGKMEEQIVNSAAALSLRKVEELIIPVSAISYIPAGMSLHEAMIRAHMDLHTRFPVTRWDDNPDEIIGYINFKDIVNAMKMQAKSPDVAGITRPIHKIQAGTPVPRALEDMIAKSIHMAVIASPDGKILGLLTLEDIIAQLVGTIKDEYDHLPSYLYEAGGGLMAGGGADMAEILRRLDLKPDTGNISLAVWVERQLKRHPRGSELLKHGQVRILVRKTRRHKVSEAFIRKLPPTHAI
ncbi:MAG: CNNM domain-containing protein [Elusimicrobiales bacterium]|nr:CNNM domain-containing protein [Elusimicrobiales bacterium]